MLLVLKRSDLNSVTDILNAKYLRSRLKLLLQRLIYEVWKHLKDLTSIFKVELMSGQKIERVLKIPPETLIAAEKF
jgi:hypothetical protein